MAFSENQLAKLRRRRNERRENKRKRTLKWLPPDPVERKYRVFLKKYVRQYFNLIEDIIIPQLPMLIQQAKALRPDSIHTDESWSKRVQDLLSSVTSSFNESSDNLGSEVNEIAKDTSKFNKNQFDKVIESGLGKQMIIQEPWLNDQLEAFQAQNLSLIRDIRERERSEIEGILQRGLAAGDSKTSMAKQIQKRSGIARRRANTIARDQVAKLNGQLTKLRQEEAGIKKYMWVTSGDERVRASHQARGGNIYNWSESPIPGEPINCRCTAQPILENLS